MEMLTRQELLGKLRTSSPTLYRFEAQGMPVMRNGKIVRYDWNDVVEWMKTQGKDTKHVLEDK